MDTTVRFEPSGKTALVAAGQTVLGAARSVGLEITTQCGAIGQCDSCAVKVEAGSANLADVTPAERTYLNESRLAAGERLACQAHLQSGEVTIRLYPTARGERPSEDQTGEKEAEKTRLREDFEKLPLDQKVVVLAEMGLNTAAGVVEELVRTGRRLGEDLASVLGGPRRPGGNTPPTGRPDDSSSDKKTPM